MANKSQNALQTRVNNGADTPQCRARLTLVASSILVPRALHAKFPQTFRFVFGTATALMLGWTEGGGRLLQFVTVPTGLPASPSAATCGRKKSPNIRSWHSALLESESCTKKTKHEEGTQTKKKTIELNSAQLRHGPMQLGIGNTSWQCWAMPLVVVVFGHVRCAIVF